MMTVQRILCWSMTLGCLLLSACGKKTPDGPSSTTLDRTALMQVAFPGWTADGAGRNWKLHIPATLGASDDAGKEKKDETFDAQVDPLFVVRLSDDDASMIVVEKPVNEKGEVYGCHGCRADYGAVQFHRTDGKWFITNRQDYFGDGGSWSEDYASKIVKLSQHAFAIKIDTFYAQSGQTTNWTDVYELTTTGPRNLLDGKTIVMTADDDDLIRPFEDNQDEDNTISNCAKMPAKNNKKPLVGEGAFECYHLDAQWAVDDKGETPGDMSVHYTGLVRTLDDDKRYRFHQINERMVWRYQNGKYVHVSGKDPTAKLTF